MKIDDIDIDESRVLVADSMNVILKTRSGLLCVNRFSPIGRSLCFYGEHGQNELDFCGKFLAPGAVVFDVGAHQGTHSVFFARAVGETGAVYSFEPQRLMFQNICASASINGLTQIKAFNLAVGETSGTVRIMDFDYKKRGHFSGMRIKPDNTGEDVKVVTLDEFCETEKKVERVDFLKVDVEGMEIDVLRGAAGLIERNRPLVYSEHHEGVEKARSVLQFLTERSYSAFLHEPKGYNPDNFFGYPSDRFGGAADHNIICIPDEALERYRPAIEGLKPVKR